MDVHHVLSNTTCVCLLHDCFIRSAYPTCPLFSKSQEIKIKVEKKSRNSQEVKKIYILKSQKKSQNKYLEKVKKSKSQKKAP